MHARDSSGRLTTAEPHETTFNTVFPTTAPAPAGVAAIAQNTQTAFVYKIQKDSSGRTTTNGDGR